MKVSLKVPKSASTNPAESGDSQRVFAVPRNWLIGLAVLLTVPWLVAAFYFFSKGPGSVSANVTNRPDAQTQALQPGPWGKLTQRPIVISPPLEAVPRDWGPLEPTVWNFPETTHQTLEQFLNHAGMLAADASRLVANARVEPRIRGLVVTPEPEFLWGLPAGVRARINLMLAKTPLNPRHHDAYRFAGSLDQWLGRSPIAPDTLKAVTPLIYGDGGFLYLADIDLLRTRIKDDQELHLLAKGLFRVSTMIVELEVDSSSDLDKISEYWGRGGRRTDIRPLMESVALDEKRQTIDISHLLPPVARLNLYRFPRISRPDLANPALANCLWTALNFLEPTVDNNLATMQGALAKLDREYAFVHDNYQLGDVVAFNDDAGNLIHAAVYLADNLVFTKNGLSPLSPWVIMPLPQIKGYYSQYGDLQVLYYRKKTA